MYSKAYWQYGKYKSYSLVLLFCLFLLAGPLILPAQYPAFTKWYQNPLGFAPLNLHTANAIIIPGVAATAILLLTKKDSNAAQRISYFNETGVSFGYFASKTTVYQTNFGLLWQARNYMSIGAELGAAYLNDSMNNTWGIGIRPFIRFYPLKTNSVSIFFQSGAGLVLFGDRFPKPSGFWGDTREGTRLNGSPKYGVGAEFKLHSTLSLQAGLWHVHFSNGNHPSRERNPAHDSNGFSIGLLYHPFGKNNNVAEYR